MKRILYIHQYFITPEEGGAIRSYHIAKGLVSRGLDVEMITAHDNPAYEKKLIEGIKVHYLPVPYSNKYSYLERVKSFLKFIWASWMLIRKLPQADLLYATSTPLTVGILAIWVKWRLDVPYIFEVRDSWPEAPKQLKIIRSKLIIGLAESIETKIYKHAKQIIALSPGIEHDILNKYPKGKVTMVPNMADLEFYKNAQRQKSSQLKIGYFGAIGIANHLEAILDIAVACQREKLPIQFVLAGEGARRAEIEKHANDLDLNNIEFHNHLNRKAIHKLMCGVDAVVISFKNVPVLGTNSPNKFFDGLAAGKLMIVNTEGWLKELVETNRCGFYSDQKHPEQFAELINPFIANAKLLSDYQKNARGLAEERFSKKELVQGICELVAHA